MPSSTMIVLNNTANSITIYGQAIGAASSFTFPSSSIAGACSDIVFRTFFMSGQITVTVDGSVLDYTSTAAAQFVSDIAAGAITIT